MPKDSNEPQQSTLGEILVLFDQAEGYIKSLEHIDGLYVPTVNQLRYAGRHLINYLNSVEEPDEQLSKAKRHCQRAAAGQRRTSST